MPAPTLYLFADLSQIEHRSKDHIFGMGKNDITGAEAQELLRQHAANVNADSEQTLAMFSSVFVTPVAKIAPFDPQPEDLILVWTKAAAQLGANVDKLLWVKLTVYRDYLKPGTPQTPDVIPANWERNLAIFERYLKGTTAYAIAKSLQLEEDTVRKVFKKFTQLLQQRLKEKGETLGTGYVSLSEMRRNASFWLKELAAYESDVVSTKSELDKPISSLGLSTRAKNCLRAESITTVGDLATYTGMGLMAAPNLGVVTRREIVSVLANRGLTLSIKTLVMHGVICEKLISHGYATLKDLEGADAQKLKTILNKKEFSLFCLALEKFGMTLPA